MTARAAVLVSALVACGSSPATLRSIAQGDDTDRVIALQANYVTLIERSENPIDAASALKAYCADHRDAIGALLARIEARVDEPGFAEALNERARPAIERLGKFYDAHPDYESDQTVAHAMRSCDGRPGVDASLPPICETYRAAVASCTREMADDGVMAKVEQTLNAAREAITEHGEAARVRVTEYCRQAYEQGKEAAPKVCPNTMWE